MKSILQERNGECYICAYQGNHRKHDYLECHHVFEGVANRKLSEKYGLKVYLCRHHHTGDVLGSKDAVHSKGMNDWDRVLKQTAQVAFETKYSHEKFMQVFGKNYL